MKRPAQPPQRCPEGCVTPTAPAQSSASRGALPVRCTLRPAEHRQPQLTRFSPALWKNFCWPAALPAPGPASASAPATRPCHQRLCRTSLLWARLCLAEDPSVPVNEGLFPKHQARSSSPGETFGWPPWSAQPRGEGLQMLLRGGTAPQGDPPGCLVTGQQTPA